MKTAERIAAVFGVSAKTVRRAHKRYLTVEKLARDHPEEAEAVRNGTKRYKQVERTIRVAAVQETAALASGNSRTPLPVTR